MTNCASRRNFLQILTTAVAMASLGPAMLRGADPAPNRPNILLILSDDHSAPHVGCYNNPDIRTPNLDKLAADGMRFDRAYVTCPQCVPSRSSIMSGRSPVATGMTRFSAPLPREVKVFPELLRAEGYYSGVAGRTYHLDGSGNLSAAAKKVFDEHKLRTFRDRLDFVKTGAGGPVIVSQFKEFLDVVPQGKPFVLQLGFNDPHRPLDSDAIPQPHDPKKLTLPAHYPDTQLVREDFARYYDEIARMDGYIGQVLSILEQRGLSQNTIVIFMGDNGASQLRGKGTLYEFGINVPLIARWPGRIKPGSNTSELISGEDLAPTFLELAGVGTPPEMTGRSFLKLLQGQPFDGRKHVFSERGAHGTALPTNSANFDLGRCVVSKTHKLIYNATWNMPYTPVDCAGDPFWKELQQMNTDGKLSPELSRVYFSPTRPMFELYNLVDDPREFNNLIGKKEFAPIAQELKAALEEWMILQRDYIPLPFPAAPKR
jgi:N-sulfoglucosamine sulfohydrolase